MKLLLGFIVLLFGCTKTNRPLLQLEMYSDTQSALYVVGQNGTIEFGGGIGNGIHPNDKKPNLAGIVKRAFRRADNPPDYHAVINGETLAATVAAITM